MLVDSEKIKLAYRKLKHNVYYDKTDLRLRKRLADFECAADFEDKLVAIENVLTSVKPWRHKAFKQWLDEIDYRLVPKKIKLNAIQDDDQSDDVGRYITNVTSTKHVEIEKVNYFFDGPIELHLIAVLWIMFQGRYLDAQLGPECCGSRLLPTLHSDSDGSTGLFQKYHEQYSRWRDGGIRKAKQMLTEERQNVAILGLDVQEYFYRIRLDFAEAKVAISQASGVPIESDESSELSNCLNAIHNAYRDAIDQSLDSTHVSVSELDTGIPIGLCSSLVLANWYLKDFDDKVKRSVRPAYYGRYVDDILMVIPAAKDPELSTSEPVPAFINEILVKTGILSGPAKHSYEILARPGLYLQQGKCILQYFDTKHSIAGLEKFQKKLEEQASDFLLMPVDEADNSMEDVAYELLYAGSVNKFRSVKGMAENRYELAKHLARQTILHLLTDDPPDPKISWGLRKFFKGKNAIEFYDLWERVFTLFQISDDANAAKQFYKHLESEIGRVVFSPDKEVSSRLVHDLQKHLSLSGAMADALCTADMGMAEFIENYVIETFRNSNLIRHHFVRKPLLNYTTYSGTLTARKIDKPVKMDEKKLEFSPRYVNFDECLLLAKSGDVDLQKKSVFVWASNVYAQANGREVKCVSWVNIAADEGESDD
jgi:hypothetical protein